MAGIPQVITEDRASGAQFIDGSLKFDSSKPTYLQRTQVGGTRKTFTWSGWIKRTDSYNGSNHHDWFSASEGDTTGGGDYGFGLRFAYNKSHGTIPYNLMVFEYENSAFKLRLVSDQVIRDFNNFYHVVIAVNTTIASPSSDRVKVYVNGERITNWKSGSNYETYPTQNLDLTVNESGKTSQIGCSVDESGVVQQADGYASNFYLIDGQQLGPEAFGYTDPLTNTWRPKKYDQLGPNNGTTWSSSGSSSASLQNGSWGQVFDGTQYMYSGSGASNGPALDNGSITFAPSGLSGRVITAGVRGGSNKTYTVNGQAMTFGSGSAEVATIDLGSTQTIASVVGTSTASGTWAQFFWIAVDGILLVDGLNDLKAFGKNGFYLPMDGNTPIGKDQSGRGNDFTPVNFGGSMELPKATGAIPILNTNDAGTVAKGGVRTDSKTYTVTASGGNYYLDGALKPTLNAYRGSSLTFDYTGATSHPFHLSSLPDGKHNSKAYSTNFDGNDTLQLSSTNIPKGSSARTVDFWVWIASGYNTWSNLFSYGGASDSQCFGINIDNAQTGEWAFTGFSTGDFNTGVQVAPYVDKWTHVAVTYAGGSGGALKIYLNGSLIGSTTKTLNTTGSTFCIGGSEHSGFSENFTGYIADFRVTSGVLYTDNFTPPNTSITTTSQGATASDVVLLCCQNQTVTTAVKTPDTISVSGDPSGNNNYHPYLYNNVHGNFGVNTATSNTTKITIPHLAADTLYYYCSAHSGMGSSINVTTDIRKADPYAWKCVLANPLVGSANDVSNQINSGTTEKVITVSGATANTSGNFYGGSFEFDGTDDALRTDASSELTLGNGAFTIECWFNRDNITDSWGALVSDNLYSGTGGWVLYTNTNDIYFYKGGAVIFLISNVIIAQTWMHIAVQRDGSGSWSCYINGIDQGVSATDSTNFSNNIICIAANNYNGSYPNLEFNGYIQDLRIYKGLAKYTENFVVGSTAPDILPDTPSGVSGKSKLTKITDGAVAFDGSGDFLQVPASEDLNVGSADFTAEAWVYPTQYGEIVGAFNLNAPYSGWLWSLDFSNSSGKQMIWFDGNQQQSTTVVPLNKWSHIAFSKSGTTVKYFLDGKLDGSFTASANSTWSNQVVHIGADSNSLTSPGRKFGGFISNLRLIKGTALYTSDFTPPTEPLTNVTNTKLLCCQDTNGFMTGGQPILNTNSTGTTTTSGTRSDFYASSMVLALAMNGSNGGTTFTDQHAIIKGSGSAKTITAYGDAQTSTAQSYFYGSSAKFDGTGDYLASTETDIGNFGTGDFTVEYWCKNSTTQPSPNFCPQVGNLADSTAGGTWRIGTFQSDGYLKLATHNGSSFTDYSFNSVNYNDDVWHHFCVQRSSGTVTAYVDGVSIGTASVSVDFNATKPIQIGREGYSPTYFNGYIQDLRIYKGLAKYSSNFVVTVPSVEHTSAVTPGSITANGRAIATNFNPFTDNINAIRAQESGYATLNPLSKHSDIILSNGNLTFTNASSAGWRSGGSIGHGRPSSGKYYFETQLTTALAAGSYNHFVGVLIQDDYELIGGDFGNNANGYCVGAYTGSFRTRNNSAYGPSVTKTTTTGATLQVAIDVDNGRLWFGCDNVWASGSPYSNASPSYTFTAGTPFSPHFAVFGANASMDVNFGQKPFKFPPPDGFQPLSLSTVQPEKVIARPDQYVSATLFTGTGDAVSSRTVELPQDADLVWAKSRDRSSSHQLLDTVRGNNLVLQSNSANNDRNPITQYTGGGLSTIDGKTITIAAGTTNNQNLNTVNQRGVIWSWKAGGSKGTFNVDGEGYATATAAGLDSGTTNPIGASVGTKQGFSIIRYTGNNANRTIAHGLSEPPKFWIYKNLTDNSTNWAINHTIFGSMRFIYLNLTNTQGDNSSSYWGNMPTSDVLYIGPDNDTNGDGDDHILYLWHDVPGLQKFGQWNNNNANDGAFIELGFKPALILLKNTDNVENWYWIDSARHPHNEAAPSSSAAGAVNTLNPDTNHDEATSRGGHTNTTVDILSNGFKIRTTNPGAGEISFGTRNYIYAAWAEAPSINLYGAQTNAR